MATTLVNIRSTFNITHTHQTLDMKVVSPLQPSARAATPAAVIISHQDRFTDISYNKEIQLLSVIELGYYHGAASPYGSERVVSHVVAGGDVQHPELPTVPGQGLTGVVTQAGAAAKVEILYVRTVLRKY